jgi:transposase
MQATDQAAGAATIPLAAFIGIDWADERHAVFIQTAGSSGGRHEQLDQQPEAIAAWAAKLQQEFGGAPVGVCLEQSRGPLIHALSVYPWIVLFPINPKSLARYREALSPSRAKDDPTDAQLLCDFLRTHPHKLRAWKADDEPTRRLRLLLENREKLVDQRTALVNQLTAVLKGYFPQALEWAGEITKPMAWAFLSKWSTLDEIKKARKQTLLSFYYAHHVRRGDRIAGTWDAVQKAAPLVRDAALVETSAQMAQALCKILQALQPSVAALDAQIAALFAQHPEHRLFDDLPGAGPVLAPRLLAAFGTDRTRFGSAAEVQRLSGIAPVTERSGKKNWVHWRWAAPAFLRQTFHEFAGHSIPRCPWAKACYEAFIARGQSHHAAVRMLAFKWIRILFRCWQRNEPYDEARYMEALRRRGALRTPSPAPVKA